MNTLPSRALPTSLLFGLVLLSTFALPCDGQVLRESAWVTDGVVNAMASTGSTVFVGGNFLRIGPTTGAAAVVDRAEGSAAEPYSAILGVVEAAISDGAGGWYLGGTISSAGGRPSSNLVHVLADGSVDAWAPGLNGTVTSLALDGNTLYAGGAFTVAAGQTRNHLAAFDVTNGALTSWNPSATGNVNALLRTGSTLYAAGNFRAIDGFPKTSLAAFDLPAGTLSPRVLSGPTPSLVGDPAFLSALAASGNSLIVGGSFANVGAPSAGAASLDSTTGIVRTPVFDVVGTVEAVVSDGSGGWFLGGTFTQVQGQPRANLAHVLADGSLSSWNPGADNAVFALRRAGSTLYVGGSFLHCGGQIRNKAAALDAVTGAAFAWAPAVNDRVLAIEMSGSLVFIGGDFSSVNGIAQRRLAAVDAGTGALAAVQPPVPDNSVWSIAVDASRLYVAGAFTSLAQYSGTFAVTNPINGSLQQPPLGPTSPGTQVNAVVSDGVGGWYVGGSFTMVGSRARTALAHYLADGSLDLWSPYVDGQVSALALVGSTLYVGGSFTTVSDDSSRANPQSRGSLAAFDLSSGQWKPWNPGPVSGGSVASLCLLGDTLYLAGSFTSVAGTSRLRLAAVDVSTGALTSWSPTPSLGGATGSVARILASSGWLWIAGTFNAVGGATRNSFAQLDPVTGLAGPWDAHVNTSTGRSVEISGGVIYVSGSFTTAAALSRPAGLAAYDISSGAIQSGWVPTTPASLIAATSTAVYLATLDQVGAVAVNTTTGAPLAWKESVSPGVIMTIGVSSSGVALGGSFSNVYGPAAARNSLAAIDLATSALTTLDLHPNGPVQSIVVHGSKLYAGGFFTLLGGQNRFHIGAMDVGTGLVTSWNPSVLGTAVNALAVSGSTVYFGGEFTSVGGAGRTRLAAADAQTGTLQPWAPAANATVRAMAFDGSGVVAAGDFTSVAATARNNVAQLDLTTGAPTAFAPNVDNAVKAIQVMGSTVVIGGSFSHVGSTARAGLATLAVSGGALSSWDPGLAPGNIVRTLAVAGDTLFAAGSLTSAGGQSRDGLAAFRPATADVLPWSPTVFGSNPLSPGTVHVIATGVGRLIVGGDLVSIGGKGHVCLAALDAVTGRPKSWDAGADNLVTSLLISGDRLVVGGGFTSIGGQLRNSLASLDTATALANAWNPNLNGEVDAIRQRGATYYVAGLFARAGGVLHRGIAAIDSASGTTSAWNPAANNGVSCIELSGNTILAGGTFTSIGGQSRRSLAALDLTTGLATPWNPNPDGEVRTLAIGDGVVYAGGRFSTLGGQSRKMLGAVDATTGLATSFAPDLGTVTSLTRVNTMMLRGSTLLVGGVFTTAGIGNNITWLRADTGGPTTSLASTDGSVGAFASARGQLFVGGSFATVSVRAGTENRLNLAVLLDSTDTGIVSVPPAPKRFEFALAQNTPNPFRRTSTIRFTLPREGAVTLTLYDPAGRAVRSVLAGELLPAGEHEVRVGGAGLAPGLYWYRLEWNGQAQAKRLVALP